MRLNRLRATLQKFAREPLESSIPKFHRNHILVTRLVEFLPRRYLTVLSKQNNYFDETFRDGLRGMFSGTSLSWMVRQRGKWGGRRKNTSNHYQGFLLVSFISIIRNIKFYFVFIFLVSSSILPFNLNYTLMKSFD